MSELTDHERHYLQGSGRSDGLQRSCALRTRREGNGERAYLQAR